MINFQNNSNESFEQSQARNRRNEKVENFQRGIRTRQMEEYRRKIRLQKQAIQQLNMLLENMPRELEGVLEWCHETIIQFSKSDSLQFPTIKIIDLFKLVEQFPCPQTIEILRVVAYKVSLAGIHQLFQYDIVGFLHRIINFPQKVTTRTLPKDSNLNFVQINLVKNCITILAILCENSERARNFIVVNYKTFLCVRKAEKRFGNQIRSEWITILCSFCKHKMEYDEQYVRIIRKIMEIFCNEADLGQANALISALTNVLKSREKWAIDLIESIEQYDILQKALELYQMMKIDETNNTNKKEFQFNYLKQLGNLCHTLNIFLIFYIEISTNQQLNWRAFFQHWFYILNQHEFSFFLYFTQARQDIYFIISNNLSDIDEATSFSFIIQNLILQFNCFKTFSINLQLQSNREVTQELAKAMGCLFNFGNVEKLASQILQNSTIQTILDVIFNKDILLRGSSTVELLLSALISLLEKIRHTSLRTQFISLIQTYEKQLEKLSNSSDEEESKMIDYLLKQMQGP